MTLDTATLVQIAKRMEQASVPLLFHEVRTPERQMNRIVRIMRWMGPTGRVVARDCLRNPALMYQAGKRRWKRGGMV